MLEDAESTPTRRSSDLSRPARRLGDSHRARLGTHALLEALRESAAETRIVSNASDPPALLRADFERGIAARIDGRLLPRGRVAKPHPAIFELAFEALGVRAERTLCRRLLTGTSAAPPPACTCQAVWFRADDDPDGPEPDFQAFTQMDVLGRSPPRAAESPLRSRKTPKIKSCGVESVATMVR